MVQCGHMVHPGVDTSPMLDSSLRRSSLERRSWNNAGPYLVIPTDAGVGGSDGMILLISLANATVTFVSPDGKVARSISGGANGVLSVSW